MASQPENPALSNAWDEPCSDSHLVLISTLIADWRELAPFLELTKAEEVDIIGYPPRPIPAQRVEMMRLWSQKHGKDATYNRLATVFQLCNRKYLLDELSELVTSSRSLSGMLMRMNYLSHIVN